MEHSNTNWTSQSPLWPTLTKSRLKTFTPTLCSLLWTQLLSKPWFKFHYLEFKNSLSKYFTLSPTTINRLRDSLVESLPTQCRECYKKASSTAEWMWIASLSQLERGINILNHMEVNLKKELDSTKAYKFKRLKTRTWLNNRPLSLLEILLRTTMPLETLLL